MASDVGSNIWMLLNNWVVLLCNAVFVCEPVYCTDTVYSFVQSHDDSSNVAVVPFGEEWKQSSLCCWVQSFKSDYAKCA